MKTIKCLCGNELDTSGNPQIIICKHCNRRYGRQAPKLRLLDVEVIVTGFGVVIA